MWVARGGPATLTPPGFGYLHGYPMDGEQESGHYPCHHPPHSAWPAQPPPLPAWVGPGSFRLCGYLIVHIHIFF